MTIWTRSGDIGMAAMGYRSDSPATELAEDLGLFQKGRRVLVLENDLMLADDLRQELEHQGTEVIGPVASVAEALDLLQAGPGPDAAILDVFLDDEVAYPVADALRTRGVPFVFAINRLAWAIPHAYADVPRAEKPVTMRRLAWALRPTRPEGDLQ